ncbi:flagellar protein FlaG [Colwellia ponticola]|uniref:flagellar protein FlaG n=1 Tax=Colwellia ponticola TaxID=2304625 RepID=UPI001FE3FD8D|nr:flagellar protein FlaG [Colwellia ponticola]
MSVNPSGSGLGGVSVASEYQRAGDAIGSNTSVGKVDTQDVVNIKQDEAPVAPLLSKTSPQELPAEQPLTATQLDKVAQQLQDFVGDLNRNIEFSVDKDSGRDVIKVIDKDSGDLLKQYPSEEVLTLVSKLSDMVGGFIDAKV